MPKITAQYVSPENDEPILVGTEDLETYITTEIQSTGNLQYTSIAGPIILFDIKHLRSECIEYTLTTTSMVVKELERCKSECIEYTSTIASMLVKELERCKSECIEYTSTTTSMFVIEKINCKSEIIQLTKSSDSTMSFPTNHLWSKLATQITSCSSTCSLEIVLSSTDELLEKTSAPTKISYLQSSLSTLKYFLQITTLSGSSLTTNSRIKLNINQITTTSTTNLQAQIRIKFTREEQITSIDRAYLKRYKTLDATIIQITSIKKGYFDKESPIKSKIYAVEVTSIYKAHLYGIFTINSRLKLKQLTSSTNILRTRFGIKATDVNSLTLLSAYLSTPVQLETHKVNQITSINGFITKHILINAIYNANQLTLTRFNITYLESLLTPESTTEITYVFGRIYGTKGIGSRYNNQITSNPEARITQHKRCLAITNVFQKTLTEPVLTPFKALKGKINVKQITSKEAILSKDTKLHAENKLLNFTYIFKAHTTVLDAMKARYSLVEITNGRILHTYSLKRLIALSTVLQITNNPRAIIKFDYHFKAKSTLQITSATLAMPWTRVRLLTHNYIVQVTNVLGTNLGLNSKLKCINNFMQLTYMERASLEYDANCDSTITQITYVSDTVLASIKRVKSKYNIIQLTMASGLIVPKGYMYSITKVNQITLTTSELTIKNRYLKAYFNLLQRTEVFSHFSELNFLISLYKTNQLTSTSSIITEHIILYSTTPVLQITSTSSNVYALRPLSTNIIQRTSEESIIRRFILLESISNVVSITSQLSQLDLSTKKLSSTIVQKTLVYSILRLTKYIAKKTLLQYTQTLLKFTQIKYIVSTTAEQDTSIFGFLSYPFGARYNVVQKTGANAQLRKTSYGTIIAPSIEIYI